MPLNISTIDPVKAVSKVLIVDDDINLLEGLKYNLENESYQVYTTENGSRALELAHREKPDLIILDIMLPDLDGFEICRILRKELAIPILMLTAKTDEVDKIVGLELGADDYVLKPFSIRELLARIRAILRRSTWEQRNMPVSSDSTASQPVVLQAGTIEIDIASHRVLRNGSLLQLSPKEFDLLLFLARHRGQVFNRDRLVEQVWGYDYEGTARTIDVHIRSLRMKIEDDPNKPIYLKTVHGFGYKLEI